MAIRDAAKIDNNFSVSSSIKKDGLAFYNAEELGVFGLKRIDGIYRRMRLEDAKRVSENVALISSESAGGRCRFATDSRRIAISVKYRSVAKVPNYSYTATLGFDLYSGERYVGCFIPPFDTVDSFESDIFIPEDISGAKTYTLNFPVCSEVDEVYIGVDEGASIGQAPEYSIKKPIVFYGSSTTQGACASRPGNTYENMISRVLDADYINLGFWGNARGEEEMAEYIASLDMSAFVYDYDYNAPSVEHLLATHERMFEIIREKNPELPIVILSAPKYYLDEKMKKRLEIVKRTFHNAVAFGDTRVAFISGKTMLKRVKDSALADNIHPGDVGFFEMARCITKELRALFSK